MNDTTFYVDKCPHGYNAVVMDGRAMHVLSAPEPHGGYPILPCERPSLAPPFRKLS